MTNLISLRKRVAQLEQQTSSAGEFIGVLDFDSDRETIEDAARRADRPGIYLLVSAGTDEGRLCEVRANKSIRVLEL